MKVLAVDYKQVLNLQTMAEISLEQVSSARSTLKLK